MSEQLFLDGWEFAKLPFGTKREEAWRTGVFKSVELPHDWLIAQSENLYETSTGWYRKRFFLKKQAFRYLLRFDGVYMDCSVYVNGIHTGEWKYGYSAFTLDITEPLRDGENLIEVEVRHQSPNSRWYSGAGIYRNVWLAEKQEAYFVPDGLYIHTEREEDGSWSLLVQAEVAGIPSHAQALHMVCELETENGTAKWKTDVSPSEYKGGSAGEYSGPVLLCPTRADLGDTAGLHNGDQAGWTVGQETAVLYRPGSKQSGLFPQLWSTDVPKLYRLTVTLCSGEKILDRESCRIGFRTIQMDPDRGFFLNGRSMKLNGVCEHHDFGALGSVFYEAACRRKFTLLKQMGVNAVRSSHNMPAKELMEIADEMGILILSEAFDMWERSKTPYDYARFFPEWEARDVASWVRRDRNHPSLLMWSIGNEIYDTHADKRGQEITRMLTEQVYTHDPLHNASVTIGSNYMPWENAQACADLVKLAGYNYSESYYEAHHKEHPDWVIYGSETSSIVQSRGIYHFPLRQPVLAEDDFQCSALGNSQTSWGAKSMERCIGFDASIPYSMGQFLWTGFDYIGEPTPYHTKNSYFGQLDTAGFPKDSYYVYQAAWTSGADSPMVHVFPYWDFNEGQMIDVRVCSNCYAVELFVNGAGMGKRVLEDSVLADYRVPYRRGTLTAVAYDSEGRVRAEETRHSFSDSSAVILKPENQIMRANGKDLLYIEIAAEDAWGYPVENACDRVQVTVTGAARLAGLDNGDSTDYDSYKGCSRKLFSGKLMAILQAGTVPGSFRMEVKGAGLKGAVCTGQVYAEEHTCEAYAEEHTCETYADNIHTDALEAAEFDDGERPVRKVELVCGSADRSITPDQKELEVEAVIWPKDADDRRLEWSIVNAAGIPLRHASVTLISENKAKITAAGDGDFLLRCTSKAGTGQIRIISQLEFTAEGFGEACKNPYEMISGGLFDYSNGRTSNGNEKGVATARDGETRVGYERIDFGPLGSDEITIWIFALSGAPYQIEIWDGLPDQPGSRLVGDVIYQKPSIWNVYQPETYRLTERLTGVHTICFVLKDKVHIKGFQFKEFCRAYEQLAAGSADQIYGDSFTKEGSCVTQIGNNVSLVFEHMDFGERGTAGITISGKAWNEKNSIHIRFYDGENEVKQIVEFDGGEADRQQSFSLNRITGMQQVTFVFMPGSCFDMDWIRFEHQKASAREVADDKIV